MRSIRHLLLAAPLLLLGACDLSETCDPELDPNCEYLDTGFTGDTGGGGCGALGEGQSRCLNANTMEMCVGGSLRPTTCDSACESNACTEAVRYVRIVDVTSSIGGQHPGADIDAVALISGGQTRYATRVTDSFIPNVSSLATDVNEVLGPPDVGPDACDLSDGAEHWISLAGGEIVVEFGVPIRSGDTLRVFECAGAAQDAFDVTIGASARLEGDWVTLAVESTGTATVPVP